MTTRHFNLRLPLAWAALAVALLAFETVPPSIMNSRSSDYVFQDTYYVIADWHYAVSLTAACVVFGVIYGVLRPASLVQRRLAWTHLTMSAMGCALIFSPTWVLAFAGPPIRYRDPMGMFTWANRVSTIGYAITLLGLSIFVCFLALELRALASKLRPRSR